MKKNTVSIGNSGEYFVAAELERRGFTAAVPMANTKDFDILARNKETDTQVAIQVKTNHGKKTTWTLSQKNENINKEDVFYIFVVLNELQYPEYYIMESKFVAESIKKSHQDFLSKKKKDGTPTKDTRIRKFSFVIDKYNPLSLKSEDFKDKWDKLK